jgi:hypothetical protein
MVATAARDTKRNSMFTIDSENNIAAHVGSPVSTESLETFATHKDLGKLVAEWPVSRLVETCEQFRRRRPVRRLEAGQEVHQPCGRRRARLGRHPAAIPGSRATGGTCRANKGKDEGDPGQGRRARTGADGRGVLLRAYVQSALKSKGIVRSPLLIAIRHHSIGMKPIPALGTTGVELLGLGS